MTQTEIIIPAEYLTSLHINGMRGRVLNIPHKKPFKIKKSPEILLVYGHHSSLERIYSLALNLSTYGNVTVPDLPGFGGMDSFYNIGKEPSFDNMSSYMATFIKLYYKKKTINVFGMSYGFLVLTKTLQRFPSVTKQVGKVISIVGFSHRDDFVLSNKFYNSLLYGSKLAKTAPVSLILRKAIFTKPIIKAAYGLNADGHVKLKDADRQERARRINFEVFLWQCNDARTYFATTDLFLTVDLTNRRIDRDLYHVGVKTDQYFSADNVEKNLAKIYNSVKSYYAKLPNHAPTVISDEKEAGKIIPPALKKELRKLKA